MYAVTIIEGQGRTWRATPDGEAVLDAVAIARRAGFRVGRWVRLGSIAGRIIGYNIAAGGVYPGAAFPLLVATAYGVAKCSVDEIRRID